MSAINDQLLPPKYFAPRFGLLQIPELKAENAAYYAHNGVYYSWPYFFSFSGDHPNAVLGKDSTSLASLIQV